MSVADHQRLSDYVKSLTSQFQEQKSEIDTLRTRLQCLHDEVCQIDRGCSSAIDVTVWSSMQNEMNGKFEKLRTRLECMQDEICRTNQAQKGLADMAWVSNALDLKADVAWIDQAFRAQVDQREHEMVSTLRTRLECLQDEVCSIHQGQKVLAEKAWVADVLRMKVDREWVEAALRLKADQGDHEKVTTLRTRLECLQDEVCSISQGQKGLAEKAWVNDVLRLKADAAWVDQALRAKADQGDDDKVAVLRTRLECLQDEVCRNGQEQARFVEKSWVVDALRLKVDHVWVDEVLKLKADREDHEIVSTLRTRLECLQDEVCTIHQGQKFLADKAWVSNALELKADVAWIDQALRAQVDQREQAFRAQVDQREHEMVSTLRTRLECLQDEVCSIHQGQKVLVDKAWVTNALELKADVAWINQAFRAQVDQREHELVSTLRTRLECLQDEVCSIHQGQKVLADKAWVTNALELKADVAWIDQAFRAQVDQREHEMVATLRTRVQCLHDELCRIDQRQKVLVDKAWVTNALELKADIAWVTKAVQSNVAQEDPDNVNKLRIRLECLQDEVCRIEQRSKHSSINEALKVYIAEQLALATPAGSTDISKFNTRLSCLQDEVGRIVRRLSEVEQQRSGGSVTGNADLEHITLTVETLMETVEALSRKMSLSGDPLQRHVHELAMRVEALICALISLYKRNKVDVRRIGGGYEYETGLYDQEAVDALNALTANGWSLCCKRDNQLPQQYERRGRPQSRSGSRSVGRTCHTSTLVRPQLDQQRY